MHIGDYKTAPNQFTQKGFTPAHREMAQSLNRDMYEQLVAGIAEARKKTEAEIRALLDQGPFVAAKALEAGLVDELAYEDQLDDQVPELRRRRATRRIEGGDYQRIRPAIGRRQTAIAHRGPVRRRHDRVGQRRLRPAEWIGRRLGHDRRADSQDPR